MTTEFFRVRTTDGKIVGISRMAEEDALLNLGEDEELRPFDPQVDPRATIWTPEGWASVDPEPGPEADYRFMRSSGYPSAGEQLGSIIKVLEPLLDSVGADVPPAALAEFRAICDRIRGQKDAYPKPPGT